MTTQRIKGEIAFSCDLCPDTFESGTRDWADAWRAAKEKGWQAIRTEKGFEHVCRSCGSEL
jgi:hypothetical protein